ncbi:hypothetical protein [Streptomyces sp. LN699]
MSSPVTWAAAGTSGSRWWVRSTDATVLRAMAALYGSPGRVRL